MRALAVFAVIAFAILAAPAIAATEWPSTLVEQSCTDDFSGAGVGLTQTAGSSDGKCDHDRRILTGALTSDTTFGPFRGLRRSCFYLFADGNTVTGGDTKWRFFILVRQPHDQVLQGLWTFSEQTGAADAIYTIGSPTIFAITSDAQQITMQLPDQWYLTLDLNTATSWTGEISMVECG